MLSSIANMNSAPESSLMITASSNVDLQNMPASPFTAQGAQSVEDVISSICASAGYEAVFNNVKGMTTSGSPHFEGSVFEQLYRICSDYGLAMSATPPTKVEFWLFWRQYILSAMNHLASMMIIHAERRLTYTFRLHVVVLF